VLVANNLNLPFSDESFDAALSIGVIHHLQTEEHRIRAVKELVRVLRIGGKVLIYVWAMKQDKRQFKQQGIFLPWHAKQKFAKLNVDNNLNGATNAIFTRFFHVFSEGELLQLVKENVCGVTITEHGYNHSCWWVLAEKKLGF